MADLSELTLKEFQARNENEQVKALGELAGRVFGRYFYGYKQHKDDLLQEATLKGWRLIQDGAFDSDRSSLYNYLFTGMRNEMTNFVKKIREVSMGEMEYDKPDPGDPDFLGWEHLFDSHSEIEIRSRILAHIEGRPSLMLNFWQDVTEDEKEVFAKLVSGKSKLTDAEVLFENNGDWLLWVLFLFAGRRVQFPPEAILEKYLRQSKVYLLSRQGLPNEEIAKRVGLRVQHIQRIIDSVKTVLREIENGRRQDRQDRADDSSEASEVSTIDGQDGGSYSELELSNRGPG